MGCRQYGKYVSYVLGAKSFNQDLSKWKTPNLKNYNDIFKESPLKNDKAKQFKPQEGKTNSKRLFPPCSWDIVSFGGIQVFQTQEDKNPIKQH